MRPAMAKAAHIIAAAGSGSRFGAPLPKQFCPLGGRPLLMTTIDRIRAYSPTDLIVVVLNTWFIDEWLDMCRDHGFRSPAIAEGGATRWQSVRNALEAIPPAIPVITVHDGARPAVSPELMARVVEAVTSGRQGALPMLPLTDSVRRVNPDGSTSAIDRSLLRTVQTPQAFDAALLRRAYQLPYTPSMTDDASVMEAAGYTDIAEVEGDPRNIKVTHPGDIDIVAMYLSQPR